jgi:hypothetical protein
MPFLDTKGVPPAHIKLEQLRDNEGQLSAYFDVLEEFRYRDDVLATTVTVPAHGDPTDLASVPWLLWWLIASYGRHTGAAIVHDTLVVDRMTRAERVRADTIFFHALEESGNNWLRHRLMWAAVSWGLTMRKSAPLLFVVFVLHVAAFWAAVVWTAFGGSHRPAVAVAAVALFALGVAWARVPTSARELAAWLWYLAAFGAGLLTPPLVVIVVTIGIVYLIDVVAACLQAATGGGWEMPTRPAPLRKPCRSTPRTTARSRASSSRDPARS